MHINPYGQGNRYNVEHLRKRKLLLHGWQIEELRKEQEQKSLTVVPLALYFQRAFAKLEIALARGAGSGSRIPSSGLLARAETLK